MEKDKKRTVHRSNSKKKGRPKLRFRVGWLIFIFILSFLACFILYMLAANFNSDFFQEEFDSISDIVPEDTTQEPTEAATAEQSTEQTEEKVITNPVPESPAADPSYFDSCCLITGPELLSMSEHSQFKDVIGSAELGAANCGDIKISSSYGEVTVYETLKLKKPKNVYLMLGNDTGKVPVEQQIAKYTDLINNLKASLPEMNIYVMMEPPVMYDKDGLTNDAINGYNGALLNMANSLGVYCIESNTVFKSESGALSESYWNYETLTFNDEGFKLFEDLILRHVG